MAAPRRDNDKAARALVDAALTSDAKACEKHGITLRTLQNYRAALSRDAELSRLFAQFAREVTHQDWANELDATLRSVIAKVRQMVEEMDDISPDALKAVVDALRALSEIAMTREVLNADADADRGQPQAPGQVQNQAAALN